MSRNSRYWTASKVGIRAKAPSRPVRRTVIPSVLEGLVQLLQLIGGEAPFDGPYVLFHLLGLRRARDDAADRRLRAEPGEGQLTDGVIAFLREGFEPGEAAEPGITERAGGRVPHAPTAGKTGPGRWRLARAVLSGEEAPGQRRE